MKNIVKILFVIMFALSSCKEIQYVQVPINRIDTVYVNRNSVDTIKMSDTVMIKIKGDTVLTEKVKYIYKTSLVRDTVKENVLIEKPVEVVKEIEVPAQLSFLEKSTMALGLLFFVLIIIRITKCIMRMANIYKNTQN